MTAAWIEAQPSRAIWSPRISTTTAAAKLTLLMRRSGGNRVEQSDPRVRVGLAAQLRPSLRMTIEHEVHSTFAVCKGGRSASQEEEGGTGIILARAQPVTRRQKRSSADEREPVAVVSLSRRTSLMRLHRIPRTHVADEWMGGGRGTWTSIRSNIEVDAEPEMRPRNGRNGRPASRYLEGGGQVRVWNVPDTLNTEGHLAMSRFAVSGVSSLVVMMKLSGGWQWQWWQIPKVTDELRFLGGWNLVNAGIGQQKEGGIVDEGRNA
ncbi:hypothetical protein CPLU01_00531 [Colletotrichum plurivorum]|uniref:Uncharacterized protein n=1 Tax=Colletotrichum plurivorum TaxID=2175906 RepID=A0A8H6NRY4_9PEZI|nr:hypothetical protein CPLU01_00531 [Colletotrichum plurivorum]